MKLLYKLDSTEQFDHYLTTNGTVMSFQRVVNNATITPVSLANAISIAKEVSND